MIKRCPNCNAMNIEIFDSSIMLELFCEKCGYQNEWKKTK